MRDCENCIYSGKDGCVKWECEFVSKEEARRIVAEKKKLTTDGDCISRKSVIQLTREMISTEEYGLMDLLDEVKKLPTIPQPKAEGDLISRKEVLELPRIKHEPVKAYGVVEYVDVKDIKNLPTIPQFVCDQDCEHCLFTECPMTTEKSTIPQTDSETEYWKERAKSYERTIVALQKGIAETQTNLTYDMVEQYAKENGFVIWTKEQTEDTLRKLLNYMDTEKQTEDIKSEIEKLPRIKVGNSNSPEVKYCIDERLIYEIFDKHISRKE